ncbi:MAG: zinc-binding dehydrogenase [Bacteroidota bacterium]
MKGIVLPAYNSNIIRAMLGMKVEELPDPRPAGNQLLVEIQAAPVNPSDIAFIRGMYNTKKTLPKVAGFEGTGIVTATGDDPEACLLLGKRVSCFSQEDTHGTWADKFLTTPGQCLVLKEEMPVEQAACFFINPFTAYSIFKTCRQKGAKTIIQNAAAGQVGGFIRCFAAGSGIKLINIVRKPEHIELLKDNGASYVLCSSEEGFPDSLKELAHETGASIAIDAVGGEMTGTILNNMPSGSELIVYGGLSGSNIGNIDTLDIIFNGKKVSGFDLNAWMKLQTKENIAKLSGELQDMIISGKIQTGISGIYAFNNIIPALKSYIGNMSAGKILLTP